MKSELKAISKRVLNFALIMMLVCGLFASLQQGSLVSANPGSASQSLDGVLNISQGDSLHVSTLVGEVMLFNLELADPPSNGSFTWQVQAPPRSGAVTLAADGSRVEVQYSPAPGFAGEDLFSIVVTDAAGSSDRIALLVSVADGEDHSGTLPVEEMLARPPDARFEWDSGRQQPDPAPAFEALDHPERAPFSQRLEPAVSSPTIDVIIGTQNVFGYDWLPNSNISVKIDSEIVGSPLSDEYGNFAFYPPQDIQAGQVIEMTDGATTKTHTVIDLGITSFDPATDVFVGKANPGELRLLAYNFAGESGGDQYPTANASGVWSFDFTAFVDLDPGSSIWLDQTDNDGDHSEYYWQDPYPCFYADIIDDHVGGWEWKPNSTITVTINTDEYTTTDVSSDEGYFSKSLSDWDIQAGDVIVVSDGYKEKTTTVTNLAVTSIDELNDIVAGTADPGAIEIEASNDSEWEYLNISTLADGSWSANFSGLVDINDDTGGYLFQYDADGDRTDLDWYVPNPYFFVYLTYDDIYGRRWPANIEVALTVNAQTFYEYSDNGGEVDFSNIPVDIFPGQTLTMTGGSYTRTYTIPDLAVTDINTVANSLSGTAVPGEVRISATDRSQWEDVTVTTDGSGAWSYVFTSIVLQPGASGWVDQYDDQGNYTEIYWSISDPYIWAFPIDDSVEGRDWLPGTSISLTIDDPATAELDYSVSRPSYSNGDVKFSLYGFDLLPGHIITMTDGSNTRTHIVTKAAVKSILTDVDKVKGVADPYSALIIYGNDRNSYEWLYPTADSYGKWAATFTKIDIKSGTYGWVYQYDVEGNATLLNWNVPNPYMRVYPQYDDVSGSSWTPNTTVKIFVDGIEKKSTTSNASGSVYFSLAPFDLKTGQVVKMTDGVYTRTHTVLKIKISGYDLVSDTITGTAKAGSQLTVLAWDGSGYYGDMRYPVADASGVWVADFSTDVDIEPGSDISAWQYDPAGNSTYVSLSIPNPNIGVYLGSDSVSGSEWTPGNTITVNIDGNIFTKIIDTSGHFYLNQSSHGLDLQPGQLISASDGVTTKDLTIADVKVTSIDQLEDTLTGTADANSEVHVVAFDEISYGTGMMIMSDPSGIWNVDFSGYEDMAPGTWGFVQQLDEDGDFTDSTYEIYKVPVVFTLSPTISAVGADPFTLTVNGVNFYPASRIIWDGVELDTMFISNGQLSAVVPAEKLVSPMAVSIQVFNPEWGGGISDSLAFKVIGTLPQFDQKLITSKVTFDWEDVPGATNYKIQLSTKKDFSILLVSTGTVDSSYAFGTKLAYNTVHYWRIKPKIGGFWQPWSPVMKFTSMDPLAKPLLLSPEPGAIITSGNTPTLDWDPVTNGFTYLVQISKLADFSTTYFKTTTDKTEFMTNPLPKGKYFWRVRAIDASGGKGPWSEVRWFKIVVP